MWEIKKCQIFILFLLFTSESSFIKGRNSLIKCAFSSVPVRVQELCLPRSSCPSSQCCYCFRTIWKCDHPKSFGFTFLCPLAQKLPHLDCLSGCDCGGLSQLWGTVGKGMGPDLIYSWPWFRPETGHLAALPLSFLTSEMGMVAVL